MPFDKKLAYDFLGNISFERLGGTPEEDKTIRLICDAVKKCGVEPKVEKFQIQTFIKGTAELEILAPYKKKYFAKPVALTGCLPKSGKEFQLTYIEAMSPAALDKVKGKAIFGYGMGGKEQLKFMKEAGVAAVINISDPGKNLMYGRRGDRALREFGRTPTITIPFEAGMEMIQKKASKVRIRLEQGERKAPSKNVVAVVKGTCPELREEILICGHHDSVPDSPGAHDNGGGSAIMMALLKHFVKNPTRRKLRFVWFGSEEQGLLGSQAYVKAHEKELEDVKMVVNIDVAGGLIGSNYAVVTGQDDLKHFVDIIGKERGLNLQVTEAAYSSDSVPFSWHEIPSINIARGGASTFWGHTDGDEFKWCGADGLAPTGEISLEFIQRLGDARYFPFKRGFNETVKKSLKDYYENRMLLSREEMPKWCK